MSNIVVTTVFTRDSNAVAWEDAPYKWLYDTTDSRFQLTREESQDGLSLTMTKTFQSVTDLNSWVVDTTANPPNDVLAWYTYCANNNISHTRTISYS